MKTSNASHMHDKQDRFCSKCARWIFTTKGAFVAHVRWCGDDPVKRFWAKVDKRGPDECWPWKGGTTHKGYGMFNMGGKVRTASRVSWELANGPIPDGQGVLHKCDNAPCVNPKHLFLGDQTANMQDMRKKGRAAKALTREQVLRVRELLKTKTGAEVARELQLLPGTVNKIKRGISYAYFI